MSEILFPCKGNQRYYNSHYQFLFNILKAEDQKIKFYNDSRKERGFNIMIGKKRILVDFGDHGKIAKDWREFDINFRYHYSKHKHGGLENTYPLTPISFYDWKKYYKLQDKISYACQSERILNNQRPGARAIKDREYVQKILRKRYGAQLDIKFTDKKIFWMKARECLVSVCVPGARRNILDRGQFQYMAFGACTISPSLDITLPFWRRPQAGIHYLVCSPDYSNLIDVIEYCKENRDQCRTIGRQAKELFLSTSTPEKIWKWMNQCLAVN